MTGESLQDVTQKIPGGVTTMGDLGQVCSALYYLLRKPLGLTQTPMPSGLLSVFVIVESAMPSFWPADQNLLLLLHSIYVSLS